VEPMRAWIIATTFGCSILRLIRSRLYLSKKLCPMFQDQAGESKGTPSSDGDGLIGRSGL
ncbi:MAG: hypothetical protein WAM69_18710, partial [Candidatus Sulfotelmatobacter sp.]